MRYEKVIQTALDEIDECITTDICTSDLAYNAGYSPYHFSRIFREETGYSVSVYVTRRRLEYALYELSQGRKIIDVAVKYGFETHAGFTKAFKKCYGFSPSLYRLHVVPQPPERVTIDSLKNKRGGFNLQVQIKEIAPITVVGYASRHMVLNIHNLADIPAFWEKINLDFGASLTTLHNDYAKSHHCEIGICFDIDEETQYFTYMVGVGVDDADCDVPLRPGTCTLTVPGGLYTVFTTPTVHEDEYIGSIQDTWRRILQEYLPSSKYEYDDSRLAFEYYDERDHTWLHDGKCCMDICVPVREK